MNVLHVYKTAHPYTYGGIEQVIHQLALGSIAQGITPSVLSLHAPGAVPTSDNALPYAVHSLPRQLTIASNDMALGVFAKFIALTRSADLVHYHFPWPTMDAMHYVSRLAGVRKPSVVTYHSDIVRQQGLLRLYRPLQNAFLKSVDRIVATSPDYAATSHVLRSFSGKVSVIPIGVEEQSYPVPDAALLNSWRQKVGPKFLLFVGALRYYKGLHVLLEAQRGFDLPLVIAGDGTEAAALRQQAQQLGLKNTVFLGRVGDADKMALLQLCHAFVFPSCARSEAFGVSLLEAAMVGKPMLSTALGTGTSFISRHGETGLVVPPNDAAALRDGLQQLWTDEALAARCGVAARARYLQEFTAASMASRYAALYRDVLDVPE